MKVPVTFENAGVPAATEVLAKALGQAAIQESGGFNGRELLKLDKNEGYWLFGQDGIEVENDAEIAVNPGSFHHGFISWAAKGNTVLGEVMCPITSLPPCQEDLKNTGERWDEQLMMELQIVSGEDTGVPLVYKTTAHGGKVFIRDLMQRIVTQMSVSPVHIVPVISLGSTSYEHKTWGTVYKPQFIVRYWVNFQGERFDGGTGIAKPSENADDPDVDEHDYSSEDAPEAASAAPARRQRGAAAKPEPQTQIPPSNAAPRRRGRQAAGGAQAEAPTASDTAPPAGRRSRRGAAPSR